MRDHPGAHRADVASTSARRTLREARLPLPYIPNQATATPREMVVSLDHYLRVPSPASPGARGLRPGGSEECVVVPSPCDARTPLQAHHALNANTGDTPLTAEKGSNEDEDSETAPDGDSPSLFARNLFTRLDGFDSFCGDMGLLDDSEVRAIHGACVPRRGRPRDGGRHTSSLDLPRAGALRHLALGPALPGDSHPGV